MGARTAGGSENDTWPARRPGDHPADCHPARMTPRPRAALPGVLAIALLATGCGGGGEDGGNDASGATTSAPASSPATSSDDGTDDAGGGDTDDDGGGAAAPFPANTDPDTGEASGDALVTVTDIRVGRHDGFDRVVFETDGTGTPGWRVEYVDAARSQGSGADIALDGDAVLQVTLTGVGYPFDTGVEEYSGPDRIAAGTGAVTEVVWDSTFEGTSVAFVGVDEETPFRVRLMEDPARVVLEVVDPT